MSACLIGEQVWEVFASAPDDKTYLGHGYTYSAHPVAAAVAEANLDIVESENLVENAKARGEQLHSELQDRFAEHPFVGNIRGLGLLAGIELVRDKESKQPFAASEGVGKAWYNILLEEGLVTRALGDTIVMSPALVATESDIREIVDLLDRGLSRLSKQLER
jgi:L-2,4-diaminobutyrate transaminase